MVVVAMEETMMARVVATVMLVLMAKSLVVGLKAPPQTMPHRAKSHHPVKHPAPRRWMDSTKEALLIETGLVAIP